MRILVLFLVLASGCASRGLDAGGLVGSWGLSKDAATAHYTFEPNAHFAFEGRGGTVAALFQGAWFTDASTLTLSVDGGSTFAVRYTITGDKLTLDGDPFTARAGSGPVTYARSDD